MDIFSFPNDLLKSHIITVIMRVLFEGDKYGYEICKEIETRTNGQYILKQPTLYSNLKRLESQGYVKSYAPDDGATHGGKRRYYSLTDQGIEVFTKSQSDWEYFRTVADKLISERAVDLSTLPPPPPPPQREKKKRAPSARLAPTAPVSSPAPPTAAAAAGAEPENTSFTYSPELTEELSPEELEAERDAQRNLWGAGNEDEDSETVIVPIADTPDEHLEDADDTLVNDARYLTDIDFADDYFSAMENASYSESIRNETYSSSAATADIANAPFGMFDHNPVYFENDDEDIDDADDGDDEDAYGALYEQTNRIVEESAIAKTVPAEPARPDAYVLPPDEFYDASGANNPYYQETRNEGAASEAKSSLFDREPPRMTPEQAARNYIDIEYKNILNRFITYDSDQPTSPARAEAPVRMSTEPQVPEREPYKATAAPVYNRDTDTMEFEDKDSVRVRHHKKGEPFADETPEVERVKVRLHDKDESSDYNNRYYIYINRMNMRKSWVLCAIMELTVLICYLVLNVLTDYGNAAELPYYIAGAVVPLLFPIYSLICYTINPDRKKRVASTYLENFMLSLVVSLVCMIAVYLVCFVSGMNTDNMSDYIVRLTVFMVLSLGFMENALLFIAFHRSKKYAV